jgi:hypothetical protein
MINRSITNCENLNAKAEQMVDAANALLSSLPAGTEKQMAYAESLTKRQILNRTLRGDDEVRAFFVWMCGELTNQSVSTVIDVMNQIVVDRDDFEEIKARRVRRGQWTLEEQ